MDMNALLQSMQAAAIPAPPAYRIALPQIALLFFIMLGPLKVIGPFAAATRDLTPVALRALAVKVFVLSMIAVIGGGLLGSALLGKWQISAPVMQLTGGLIFVLVALQMVMQQYQETPAVDHAAPKLMHLVFPVSVTPYGIATVILLLALAADTTRMVEVLAVAAVVLALNLLSMMASRSILHWIGLPLQIAGAVLAVLQVALGLEILIPALAAIVADVAPG